MGEEEKKSAGALENVDRILPIQEIEMMTLANCHVLFITASAGTLQKDQMPCFQSVLYLFLNTRASII